MASFPSGSPVVHQNHERPSETNSTVTTLPLGDVCVLSRSAALAPRAIFVLWSGLGRTPASLCHSLALKNNSRWTAKVLSLDSYPTGSYNEGQIGSWIYWVDTAEHWPPSFLPHLPRLQEVSLGSHWDPVPHSQEDLLQPGASSSKAAQS